MGMNYFLKENSKLRGLIEEAGKRELQNYELCLHKKSSPNTLRQELVGSSQIILFCKNTTIHFRNKNE